MLVAVSVFFFLWRLSCFGLIGADEPRYAQVAREMLARNDMITPTLGGNPWLEKPPLYYWQAMLAYRWFGVSDWAARLPSVFDAFLLVIALYCLLRSFRPEFALDGALTAATSAGIVGYARAASMDMPLGAAFGIAMLAWYAWFESESERPLCLAMFYGFLALATLAKGPVAPLLAMVIIAIFTTVQRSLGMARRTLWIPGMLLFCAVALPWYVLVQLRNPHFFHEFIVEHNLARFGTNLYHHPERFWYYIPVTLLGWVPWSVFAVAALVWTVREWRKPDGDRLRLFLLIWIAVVVIFFSLSQSKLPGYVLPALPAGAILAAHFAHAGNARGFRFLLAGLHAGLAAALIFSALISGYLVMQHRVPWNAAAAPLTVAVAVAASLLVLLNKSEWRSLRPATLLPAVLALALALRFGARPLDEALSARPVANKLASFDPRHLPVAVFLVPRETEFGLAFYRDQIVSRYERGQVPLGEHLVVAAQGFQKGIRNAAGRRVIYLGNFLPQGLEYFYVPAP